ncbi:flavoprotein [Kitasatospora sp. GAS204B]|uniref:flavoprotein n=1 Tax=unclassified Kitasatospora TaxID=2633591 RepID=UPI002474DA2D|nr:flavoprotein [Kitasatospora sp. GAS204B]MDH6117007.1 phosphopantothenoylcysteine synthetase/decarboxylase [Kitasatospora sp. GAS204B]
MTDHREPFLYVVVCASGIADGVSELITAAHAEGWKVGVIAAPSGLGFIDQEAVEAQTGYPIRSAWRTSSIPQPLPPADAIAVAPATINKWAAGISDTLALGILCEAYGLGIPVAVQPYVNSAQAAHPAYDESLARLRSMGVLIGDYVPHMPKAGGGRESYNWTHVLDLLRPVARSITERK